MTRPPASPPALSSGALADKVREALTRMVGNRRYDCGASCCEGAAEGVADEALAALAQLVARLEQAEGATWEKVQAQQAANRKMQRKYDTVKGDLRVANDALAASEKERNWLRIERIDHIPDICAAQYRRVSDERSEARAALAACEHTRDDALAALHYIKQHYGPLDGVGWNRLTGDET